MIRNSWFLILFILVDCSIIIAQTNKDIKRADAYYYVGQYLNAVKYYERGRRKANTPYVYYQLSKCYRKLDKPSLSVDFLLKLRSKSYLNENQKLDLGLGYKILGKYNNAKQLFDSLSMEHPQYQRYSELSISCDSSETWNKQSPFTKVIPLNGINTEFSEISPFPHGNSLLFSSNREKFIRNRAGSGDELPYYDLYKAEKNTYVDFIKIEAFSSSINSSEHESSATLDSMGSKIFFTQHAHQSGDSLSKVAHLKIFYLEKINNMWGNSHTFIYNDSSSSFAHPFITADGKMFFFVSDMQGGLGGTDIYVSILKDSLWSMPINIGSPINTPGNEIYPFYSDEDKTLYFSSDYHLGMGGYDIFKAVENEGSFTIYNMKPPINSSYDDFGLSWETFMNKTAYFVSNRPGGKGLEDIYKVKFLK